jgi:hypothetical protein
MEHPSPFPVSAHYRQPQGQPQGQPQPQSYGAAPGYPPPGGQIQPQGYGQPMPIPHPQGVYAPPGQAAYRASQAKPRLGLMAGGSMLALAALVITPKLSQSQVEEAAPFTCIKQEQVTALVSRDQLKRLIETDLQTPKGTVREFLQQPYCVLSPGQTQAGQPADREAYPLEFDPQTWLVVLFEGDRYAGYDFRFR